MTIEGKSKVTAASSGTSEIGTQAGAQGDAGSTGSDFEALQQIIRALSIVQPEHRLRVLQSVMTFFEIDEGGLRGRTEQRSSTYSPPASTYGLPTKVAEPSGAPFKPLDFSTRQDISPKDFMKDKQPQTDVERVACLAYYLAHYRNAPHFKTLELSKINTEAAQPKLTNAAYSVNNALNSGYLVPASKGQKQLSAAGEQFVQLLPDREAAKAAMANARTRRKTRRGANKDGQGGSQ